jgi:uncharacterized protein with PIN domain
VEAATAEVAGEVAEWKASRPRANFEELELEVLTTRKRFGEQLMQVLLQDREEILPVPGPRCPKCDEEMHYTGQALRRVVSSIGETQMKRGYYYCSKCQWSVLPAG